MDIKQRLLYLLIKYWHQELAHAAVKLTAGVVIFGGAAAPIIITTAPIHHKQAVKPAVQVNKPVTKAATPKKTVAKAPAKPKPKPQPSEPATKVATTPKVAVAPKPKPIPATSPSPGSGAKRLQTASPDSGSGTTSTDTSGGASAPTPPEASGGYTSTNWSGYVATTGIFTSISGSWLATTATGVGSSTSADSTWVGIGGVNSSDLIQTGTMNIIAADGTVSTYAFYELLPDAALIIPSLTVTPGDNMSATINETSLNKWAITITDVTTGKSFSVSPSYSSTHSSAEWIQEDPSYASGSLVPLDHFGSAIFTGGNATMNGLSVDIASAGSDPIALVDSSSNFIAIPSILSGGGFYVYQK